MSISKGRYFAMFAKPGHGFDGKKTSYKIDCWRVFMHRRSGFDLYLLEGSDAFESFPTFEQARVWAVDRLNELVEREQANAGI